MSLRELLFGPAVPPQPDYWPIHDEASLVRCAQAMGYVCIKAHVPPDPRVGECWVPTRKEAIERGIRPRWITYNDGELMMYKLDGDKHTQEAITLASHHRWVRRTRVVCS